MRAALRHLLVLLLAAGCMAVPERYRLPQQTYPPRVERVVVTGFERQMFRQTSGGGGYAVWGAGTGVVAAESWGGEYRAVTDLPAFKALLENTGCIKVITASEPESGAAMMKLVGETAAEKHTGSLACAHKRASGAHARKYPRGSGSRRGGCDRAR